MMQSEYGPRPKFRPFELVDNQELPRYVGIGPYDAPWRRLWQNRHVDGSRLAAWLRTLDEPPRESTKWLPCGMPMRWREAKAIAAIRVRQIAEWSGTWPELPEWYLGEFHWRPDLPHTRSRPVRRVHPDGRTDQFPSIRAAARAVGSFWTAIDWRVRTGCTDREGFTWLADCVGSSQGGL